jgi:hypothetical protein
MGCRRRCGREKSEIGNREIESLRKEISLNASKCTKKIRLVNAE